jgi:hypothetical protein
MIFNCTSKSIRPKKNDLEDNRIGRLNSMGLIYLKEYFLPKEKKNRRTGSSLSHTKMKLKIIKLILLVYVVRIR